MVYFKMYGNYHIESSIVSSVTQNPPLQPGMAIISRKLAESAVYVVHCTTLS